MNFRELASPRISKLHPAARVLLSAIPGSQADLGADLRAIDDAGIRLVLCLVREGELGSYGKAMAARTDGTFRWHHCPTPAACGTGTEIALRHSLAEVIVELKHGHTVLIHCQLGQVRTGCAAAALLVLLGADPKEAGIALETAGSFPFEGGPLPLFEAFCEPVPQP